MAQLDPLGGDAHFTYETDKATAYALEVLCEVSDRATHAGQNRTHILDSLALALARRRRWFIWAGWPEVGWIVIGASIGAFFRDVNRILGLFHTWPAIREIIDWDRLRELSQSHEKRAA